MSSAAWDDGFDEGFGDGEAGRPRTTPPSTWSEDRAAGYREGWRCAAGAAGVEQKPRSPNARGVVVSIYVDRDLRTALREHCRGQGISLSRFLSQVAASAIGFGPVSTRHSPERSALAKNPEPVKPAAWQPRRDRPTPWPGFAIRDK